MKSFFLFTTVLVVMCGSLVAAPASAIKILPDGGLVPKCERTLPGVTVGEKGGSRVTNRDCTLDDFLQMLINLIEWFLAILGAGAFLMFFYGGIMFAFSFGNKKMVESGKGTLVNTVLALVVILGAYTAVKLVASVMGVGNAL